MTISIAINNKFEISSKYIYKRKEQVIILKILLINFLIKYL